MSIIVSNENLISSSEYRHLESISKYDFPNINDNISTELSGVKIAPHHMKSLGIMTYGGLLNKDSRPLYTHHLRLDRKNKLLIAGVRTYPDNLNDGYKPLHGRWLYGGNMMWHFGHFMSESSHRLYYATDFFQNSKNFEGIVFSARMPLYSWQEWLIREYYNIDIKIHLVIDRSYEIESLVIPPQGSILGANVVCGGYSDFINHYQVNLLKRLAYKSEKKLFIGRSHLNDGGINNEEVIFKYLEKKGYVYYKPEAHKLENQLYDMANASSIVAIGGSFVHLFDHLSTSNAKVLLIGRGDSDMFYHHSSLEGKVVNLDIIVPGIGDEIEIIKNDNNRERRMVNYDLTRVYAKVNEFLKL